MTDTEHDQDLFQELCIRHWDELLDYYRSPRGGEKRWVFRGRPNADWGLETTLERQAERFSIDLSELSKTQPGLVRRFKREASLYISAPPDGTDVMQWVAPIQHYGAPTRLLDWTYPFLSLPILPSKPFNPGAVLLSG
jgi:hypothetical protein